MKNLDLVKLREYYDFLVEYGGDDLSGGFDDMVEFVDTFDNFKEFIEYELEMVADDDLELYDEIINKFID